MKNKSDTNCGNCGKRIIHFKSSSVNMTPCLDHDKCGAWLLWVKEGDENHLKQIKENIEKRIYEKLQRH